MTPKGVVECRLKRVNWCGAEVISADMWQSAPMNGVDNAYTSFSATVYMEWICDRYKIIQPPRNPYNNDFWQYMEVLISCTIIVNE